MARKVSPQVQVNRQRYLEVMRSGKYRKGTIKSDPKGYPIIENDSDDNGHCACSVMIHEFPDENGKEGILISRKALGIKPTDCRYIQGTLNDSPLTFPEIADIIEKEIFN